MKKTLIAIAALAATGAFAQSTVTIDGLVDAGYVAYDMKGAKTSGVDRNLSSTSQINFRVASDLGGGLKATWRSETDFVVTSNGANQGTVGNVASTNAILAGTGLTNGTASTFMNGEQKLALSGGFGEVAFGAINNTALGAHVYSQPFGTAIGSGFRATSGSAVSSEVRSDNSFQYTSPSLVGGLKLNWINRKAQSATAANANYNASLGAQQQASVNSFAAMYSAGPLNAIITRDVQDATGVNTAATGTGTAALTAGTRGTFTALAGNYNLGATTIYAGYQGNKAVDSANAVKTDRSTLTLAASYVMGVNTFMGSYQRASNSLNSTSSNLLGLGYEYALSKTAAVVARYERIADGAGLAATTGYNATAGNNDRTRMGVGLRVGF